MENWESYVRKVVPYVPGEQPQAERMIKLNTKRESRIRPRRSAGGPLPDLTRIRCACIRNRPVRCLWMRLRHIMDWAAIRYSSGSVRMMCWR